MGSGVGLVLLLRLLGCRRKGEEEVKWGRVGCLVGRKCFVRIVEMDFFVRRKWVGVD